MLQSIAKYANGHAIIALQIIGYFTAKYRYLFTAKYKYRLVCKTLFSRR